MDAIGSGLFFLFPPGGTHPPRRRHRRPSSSGGGGGSGDGVGPLSAFPLKQAVIAACLTSTGDTIAQVNARITAARARDADGPTKDITSVILSDYDWPRSLRMASYGFLLYGPGSYAWYQFLDRCMPKQTFVNLSLKVLLNQIVLGPCVISVIFAWNSLWLGKLSELPAKYKKDALPTLLYGFQFWIPMSILNFGVVPLAARVAFMSTCSIFWNYYLSTTMSK